MQKEQESNETSYGILGVLAFAFFVVVAVSLGYYGQRVTNYGKGDYYENFDLNITGQVFHIADGSGGCDKILCLKVMETNYSWFDQSDTLHLFYALANDSIAVINDYGGCYDNIPNINDIVQIHGKTQTFIVKDPSGQIIYTRKGLQAVNTIFPRKRMLNLFRKYSKEAGYN